MQLKTLEENEEGELLGFNAVATKLLGVVTAPIQSALNSGQIQVHAPVHGPVHGHVHTCVMCLPIRAIVYLYAKILCCVCNQKTINFFSRVMP